MRIKIGVVAHTDRKVMAQNLSERVGADVRSIDNGNLGVVDGWFDPVEACARNHIRTLRMLAEMSADWAVVLEDDAEPVPNLRQHLASALMWAESSIVGLYLGTGNPDGPTQQAIVPAVKEAKDAGIPWINGEWFISTVGYAVRSEYLPYLIRIISGLTGPVDNRINTWTHAAGLDTWYTQPSLVDHDDGPSVISVTGIPDYENTKMMRRAHSFGIRDEWDSRTVKLGHAEGWSR